MAAEQIEVLLTVVTVLEKLGIAYVIGGSFASSAHGIARATMDIDLVAEMKPEDVGPLVRALEIDFYADELAIRGAVTARSHFNLIHLQSMFKIDVFVVKGSGFEQKQLERRQLEVVAMDPKRAAYVATPEDIILAKLQWYRKGRDVSDVQWRDVIGVIQVQADKLDLDYLREWGAKLGVTDLLERALSESATTS